jgi:hypothetical protein
LRGDSFAARSGHSFCGMTDSLGSKPRARQAEAFGQPGYLTR